MKNNELSFFDRFLYKLLIAMIILTTIVVMDKVEIVDYNKVKNEISSHFNIIEVLKTINGDELTIIPVEINDDITVSSSYNDFEEITDGVKVNLGDYQAVEIYKVGVVIKTSKNINNTYKVTVLGSDDYEYVYDELESIDCHIYQLVEAGEIIGKASSSEEGNYFHLYLFNKGKKLNFLELYES